MQNAHAMAQRWLCHICRAKEAVIQAGRYIEKRPQGCADSALRYRAWASHFRSCGLGAQRAAPLR
jgi:hypothetical protein